LHQAAGLVPGERWGCILRLPLRLLRGVVLAVRGGGRGEQAPAFLGRHPFLHELEEHPTGGASAGAIFGQHAAAILTLERVGEDGGTAVLTHRAQDLQE